MATLDNCIYFAFSYCLGGGEICECVCVYVKTFKIKKKCSCIAMNWFRLKIKRLKLTLSGIIYEKQFILTRIFLFLLKNNDNVSF